jgi:hypothetical protein
MSMDVPYESQQSAKDIKYHPPELVIRQSQCQHDMGVLWRVATHTQKRWREQVVRHEDCGYFREEGEIGTCHNDGGCCGYCFGWGTRADGTAYALCAHGLND